MTDKKDPKEHEIRSTFTTSVLNVSTVLTAVQAEVFQRKMKVEVEKMGGYVDQTWGLVVKGNKTQATEFSEWLAENLPKLCAQSPISNFFKGM